MGVAARPRADDGRSRGHFVKSSGNPAAGPAAAEFTGGGASNCPELDCVRALLPGNVIEDAAHRAAALGIGADRVLIAAGTLSEEAYLRALGAVLGVAFEPLDDTPRALCPLNDERLIESAAAAGMLPLTIGGDFFVVVAPRGAAARRLLLAIKENPSLALRFRFTSAERLNRFVLRCAETAIAARATDFLKRKWPSLSAAPPRWRANVPSIVAIMLPAIAAFIFAPAGTMLVFEVMLAAVFLAWLGLRLAGACVKSPIPDPSPGLPDAALPVYTVIAALYREAASVDGLLRAIERLDYPAEKLDVIIVVEADDRETRAAIAARKTRVPVTVIPVPTRGPRTKPKALNVALPFAHGTFTVIYDAEDRPEPNQLRRALQEFRAGGGDLACVQARLSIDNDADSWLAQLFTAEYAAQFDVFLPGLAALHLPLPLGGSSNHFYTATLREAGGWDPYNVTEDADLGMRLARFSRRTGVIDSTTYEEAPAHLGAWLRQRTRWFKGWMQTWLVHMRQPARLFRELGLPGFLTFQLIVGGNALAALVHPLFMGGLIYAVSSGAPPWRGDSEAFAVLAAVYGVTAIIGYLTSAFLGWLGLSRRGLLSSAWILLLTPVHWLLLSLAAWRALHQLVVAPYAWEKTEHGLAKSSRRAARLTRSPLAPERHLSALKDADELPALAPDTTGSTITRQRRSRAAA
jgi:cellulose synthase/poly-beta-1,6-N-acetylglucosamine synthase-like glycosyltransferase